MASPILTLTAEQLSDPLFFFADDERQLLRRCATVRAVDEVLYDAVLRANLPGVAPSFTELAAESYAERIPGAVERFALRDPLRSRAYQNWWTDGADEKPVSITDTPPALRRFSVGLVDYYTQHEQPLERLYHLAAADRDAAAQEFQQLFYQADAVFDLPFCTALIQLMEDREAILGEKVDVIHEARRRLRARTIWAREQYETASYLERASTSSLLDDLLGDDKRRLLQIYAPGGMGKTMFLRAAIARRCVPSDIPCARIDFDLEPKDVAHSAWRLYLRMAQQLSQQLPRNPFEELLAQYERHLTPQRTRPSYNASSTPTTPLDQNVPQRVVNSFLEKLEEIDHPFLVIFDTLENLRGNEDDQKRLYEMLEALQHSRNEAARVILAGRFDLRQPIEGSPPNTTTEFSRRFADKSVNVQFSGFTDAEACAYLTEQRKLANDDRIPVLVDKARTPRDGVNPFTLALLANVVRANPKITAAEIAAYPNANLAYLIERVIERIDNEAVRWVVRYGVAPRRLTREYVERVLLPVFHEVRQHPGELDDTQKDKGVPRDSFGKPAASGDGGQLWQNIYRYVSDYSWVMTASDVPNALVFHASVLEPMRELLWKQLQDERPVLRLLHQRSLAFYESLALEDSAQTGRWLREALFHKVQSGAEDVDAYWFEQMAAYPQQANDLASEALALVAEAEGDEELQERRAAIGSPVQAAAAYRLADNLARTSPQLDREKQERLQGWLATIERCNPANQPVVPAVQPVVPAVGLAYLRARLQQAQDKVGSALETVEAALLLTEQPQTVIDLHLLRGDLLRQKQPGAALEAYRAAFQTANSQEPARLPDAALRLGALLHSLHENQEALAVQEQLFAYARTANETDLAVESLVAQVGLLVEMGLDGQAAGTAGGSNGLPGEVGAIPRHHRIRLLCEGALAEWQAEAAWSDLESLTRTGSGDSLFLPVEWAAIDADLRARIAAMQADLRTAYSRYRQSSSQFATSQDHAARCLLYCARLALDEAGDLNQCADYLSQISSFAVEVETDVTRRLLACRLLARRGQAEKAQAMLQELWAEVQATGNVFVRVPVAIARLALGGDVKTLVDQINQDLATIEPVSQRLVLLEGMQRCPVLAVSSAAASRLIGLLPTPESSGQDPALAGLRLADVYRVCGYTEEALGLLEQAWTESGDRLAILRQIFLAYDRLGWSPHLLDRARYLLLSAKPPEIPDLLGLTALELAERLHRQPFDVKAAAGQMLDFASQTLNHPSSLWTARITALQARLALAANDRQQAESLTEEARKAYLSLGDDRAAEELRQNIFETTREAAAISKSLTPDETPFTSLTVELRERDVMLEVESRAGLLYQGTFVIDETMQEVFFTGQSDAYAEGFPAGFSRDWLAVSRQMGALLFAQEGGLSDRLETGGESVLRLSTRGRQSQWLPWELLRHTDTALPLPLAWEKLLFYRHIPFASSVARQESSPTLLIVRMSDVQQRVVMRGSRQLLGADIANLYRQAGVAVTELQESSTQELQEVLVKLRPGVIHFIANIRGEGNHLWLDVGADGYSRSATSRGGARASKNPDFGSFSGLELTPRELSNLVRRAGIAPFVILDTPAPASVTEWVRQLCLRNAFAGEWAQTEPPAGILATGMGFQEEQTRLYTVLLETLPQGIGQGELVRRIWEQARGDRRLADVGRYDPNNRLRRVGMERMRDTSDLPGYFSYVSAALFTGDPELRIPPLGKGG